MEVSEGRGERGRFCIVHIFLFLRVTKEIRKRVRPRTSSRGAARYGATLCGIGGVTPWDPVRLTSPQ